VAELAVRDGYLTPHDLPRGDCVMTSLPDGSIRIDHADPRILISAELVELVMIGHCPHAVLDWTGPVQLGPVGALLKVAAVNQTLIYRLTEYVPAVHGYIAEWPD
jgi:hypothetical protein